MVFVFLLLQIKGKRLPFIGKWRPFQDGGPRFESPGSPTQGIFLASYLVSMVSRLLWHPED